MTEGKRDAPIAWKAGYVVVDDSGSMRPLSVVRISLGRMPFAFDRYLNACNMVDIAIRRMMRTDPHIPSASEVEDK